jgi:hypothetical protein
MAGMRKSRGTPQADEEFLESVGSGQEPDNSRALGTEDPSRKALEANLESPPKLLTTPVKTPGRGAPSLWE